MPNLAYPPLLPYFLPREERKTSPEKVLSGDEKQIKLG
jgi:hypothetical protein